MIGRLFSTIFYSKTKRQSSSETDIKKNSVPSPTPLIFRPDRFTELGSFISGAHDSVIERLELFVDDKQAYFCAYEDELIERGVDELSRLSPEIALIDSLVSAEKVVYVDHSTEGHLVLIMLDRLVDGKLSKHEGFKEISDQYQSNGRYNTIGNFIDHEDFSPTPQSFTEKAGFCLVCIDEGTDSYALLLVQSHCMSKLQMLVDSVGINVKYFSV